MKSCVKKENSTEIVLTSKDYGQCFSAFVYFKSLFYHKEKNNIKEKRSRIDQQLNKSTECPKICRKCVLHLLKYRFSVNFGTLSINMRDKCDVNHRLIHGNV